MSGNATPPPGTDADTRHWHTLTTEQTVSELASDPDRGLDSQQAALRLQQAGPNRLAEEKPRSRLAMLLSQFSDFMILVLIAAAVLAGVSGDQADTLSILAILLLNALIGFTQEARAEKAMRALRQMAAPLASVIRQGEMQQIPSADLVPGDLVLLEAGNMVPADLRLLHSADLHISEAALTGESLHSGKNADAIADPACSIADRENMAYKGTLVTTGRGRGMVVATGMQTELGRIASLLSTAEETRTPLQKRLTVFSKRLALSILLVCTVIFLAGIGRGEPLLLMLLTAVSLAVAAIPESLPAVVTIALALGAYKLARHKALMRNLNSVETLGSVTWICSDKTGTLTENRMRVEQYFNCSGGQQPDQDLLNAMLLCNDAGEQQGRLQGDPTETALLEAALSQGLSATGLRSQLPRLHELAFTSERMRMTTFHQDADSILAYSKGAPEVLIDRCTACADGSPWNAARMHEEASRLAASGMRVLAFAMRRWQQLPDNGQAEEQLLFLGLAGLMDPPRASVAEAIATCKSAGITPVMITGDHPETAMAIARRLGLGGEQPVMLTGRQLTDLSDETLEEQVKTIQVYARMDPSQKIRIVRALQSVGQYVAMTGDGVNDAPALKQADIGVAMGCSGTDVSREAADMILLDDNFATIVTAIKSGRRIYDNIRSFIRYILTTNLSEVLLILLAPLLGMPLPLLPIQILWINLVTDGLPGLALTLEKAQPDIMQRPPRSPGETLFSQGLWFKVIWTGLLMAALVLALQAYTLNQQWPHWQTMVFTALTFTQLGNVLVIRSERVSLWRIGLLSNPMLLLTLVLTVSLHLLVVYLPWANDIFSTTPLSAPELLFCLAAALPVMLAVETEKWLLRLRRKQ